VIKVNDLQTGDDAPGVPNLITLLLKCREPFQLQPKRLEGKREIQSKRETQSTITGFQDGEGTISHMQWPQGAKMALS
jgi:hypothetical protein